MPTSLLTWHVLGAPGETKGADGNRVSLYTDQWIHTCIITYTQRKPGHNVKWKRNKKVGDKHVHNLLIYWKQAGRRLTGLCKLLIRFGLLYRSPSGHPEKKLQENRRESLKTVPSSHRSVQVRLSIGVRGVGGWVWCVWWVFGVKTVIYRWVVFARCISLLWSKLFSRALITTRI